MPERAAYKKQDKSHWPDFKHKAKSTRENKKITNRMTRRKKKQEVQEEMADREKVIKGLECCVSGTCNECPYQPDGLCDNTMMYDALSFFQGQEPVKPIFDENDVSGRCGVCGHVLTHQSMIGDVLVDEWFQYCPRCGQEVKWNG